jgi:hypothetical protein
MPSGANTEQKDGGVTIEQLDVVDNASIINGDVVLTISDHLRWDAVNDHLFSLQEKLNAYLRLIESGILYKKHPEGIACRVIFSVLLKFPAPASAQWFFSKVVRILEGAGYGFEVRQMEIVTPLEELGWRA